MLPKQVCTVMSLGSCTTYINTLISALVFFSAVVTGQLYLPVSAEEVFHLLSVHVWWIYQGQTPQGWHHIDLTHSILFSLNQNVNVSYSVVCFYCLLQEIRFYKETRLQIEQRVIFHEHYWWTISSFSVSSYILSLSPSLLSSFCPSLPIPSLLSTSSLPRSRSLPSLSPSPSFLYLSSCHPLSLRPSLTDPIYIVSGGESREVQ